MHVVLRAREYTPAAPPPYAAHSRGYAAAPLIDHATASVHTGLSLNVLEPGGFVAPHVHSFEEGVYLLEGHADVQVGDATWRLVPGDFAVAKVGVAHGWRNAGAGPVRWLSMSAPQPKPPGGERDTFFVRNGSLPTEGLPVGRAAAGSLVGHFAVDDIPASDEARVASGGLKGVFLRWLIDEAFGARHHRMVLIEYQPGVSIGLHDHTFEEAYFVVSGQVEATLDGAVYTAGPGDVLWTGVGCVHAFANTGSEPVRWLETFAPQPPAENVFRFRAEWLERARLIEG